MPYYNAIEKNLNFEKMNNNIICYSGILILSLSLSLSLSLKKKKMNLQLKEKLLN